MIVAATTLLIALLVGTEAVAPSDIGSGIRTLAPSNAEYVKIPFDFDRNLFLDVISQAKGNRDPGQHRGLQCSTNSCENLSSGVQFCISGNCCGSSCTCSVTLDGSRCRSCFLCSSSQEVFFDCSNIDFACGCVGNNCSGNCISKSCPTPPRPTPPSPTPRPPSFPSPPSGPSASSDSQILSGSAVAGIVGGGVFALLVVAAIVAGIYCKGSQGRKEALAGKATIEMSDHPSPVQTAGSACTSKTGYSTKASSKYNSSHPPTAEATKYGNASVSSGISGSTSPSRRQERVMKEEVVTHSNGSKTITQTFG